MSSDTVSHPPSICDKFLFQVIGINGQFPGPTLNVTTNWNVVVNVKNNLDEPLMMVMIMLRS